MNFEDEIKNNFSFLFKDYNFKILRKNIDEDLQDFIVFAGGHGIQLMFVRDRADFSLKISNDESPDESVEFYEVLGKLKDKTLIPNNYKSSNKMNHVKGSLKEYLQIIINNRQVLQ